MRVVIMGAGMAGLSAALALGRAGHEITLVERDSIFRPTRCEAVLQTCREGIPHFFQLHIFWPRGSLLLKRNFPDVYQALLDVGACELHLYRKIRGESQPSDEELVYLGVRRPLIEWALLQAVLKEPNVQARGGVRIIGLLGQRGTPPRVSGIRTDQGDIVGDLIDHRGPSWYWLQVSRWRESTQTTNRAALAQIHRHKWPCSAQFTSHPEVGAVRLSEDKSSLTPQWRPIGWGRLGKRLATTQE